MCDCRIPLSLLELPLYFLYPAVADVVPGVTAVFSDVVVTAASPDVRETAGLAAGCDVTLNPD